VLPFGIQRASWQLMLVTVPLASLASLVGLLEPATYRDAAWLVPQSRGQDLVTLLAMLALAPLLLAMRRRGSARATLAALGIEGYVLYTYVGAAFEYAFNQLFLLYVVLFATSTFALASALRTLDVAQLASTFNERAPRRSVAGFLFGLAAMLGLLWLGQLVPALLTQRVPESIARSNGGLRFVFALDLGIIAPLSALGARWLLQRKPWGYVLAAIVTIKAATMGLALLSMTAFSVAAGQPTQLGLAVVWIVLAVSGSVMAGWLLLASTEVSSGGHHTSLGKS
jgi:hypothetical protein